MSHEDLSFSERSKTHIYAIDENGLPYSPRWYTLSLMTNYEFNKNILLRVGIENIMDAQYRPYSSGIVAPGRALLSVLEDRFKEDKSQSVKISFFTLSSPLLHCKALQYYS